MYFEPLCHDFEGERVAAGVFHVFEEKLFTITRT